MKTITFISHYNEVKLNIRLNDEKAYMLLNNKNYTPIELYCLAHDRVISGEDPKVLSRSQVKKLDNYLSGIDYWDACECRD